MAVSTLVPSEQDSSTVAAVVLELYLRAGKWQLLPTPCEEMAKKGKGCRLHFLYSTPMCRT
jgi:hypothetical protein